jgi:hypothetical protein
VSVTTVNIRTLQTLTSQIVTSCLAPVSRRVCILMHHSDLDRKKGKDMELACQPNLAL